MTDTTTQPLIGCVHHDCDKCRAQKAYIRELEDAMADAERYRWLREQNADLEAGTYVGDETDALPEDITWVGCDLDAHVDAAINQLKARK